MIEKAASATIILILALFLLSSCDAGIKRERKTYLISVSSDYRDQDASVLYAPNHDQYGLARQVLALDDNAEEVLFMSSCGRRYIMSTDGFGYTLPDPGKRTKTALDILPHKEYSWSSADVLACISEIASNAGEDDLILFQYSGHGAEGTGEMVFSAKTSSKQLRITDSVSPAELLNAFAGTEGTVLIIMDSCYSGSYIKENVLADGSVFTKNGNTEEFSSIGYLEGMGTALNMLQGADRRTNPNIYVIAASSESQTSWDSDPSLYKVGTAKEERFGGFTYYLLKALGYDPLEDEPHMKAERITLYGLYDDIWNSMRPSHRKAATPLTTLSPLDIILFNP